MRDGLPLRLRLVLGRIAAVGEERPSTGGARCFDARLAGAAVDSAPTHQVVVGAAAPDGPAPASVAALVQAMQELKHPHLVEVAAVGEFEGRAWVVEELPNAPTVAERIRSRGVLSIQQAAVALREIARVLVSLHRRGVVHGSIHPKMIYLPGGGGVRLRTGPGEGIPAEDLRALGDLGWVMLTGAPSEAGATVWRPGMPSELRDLLEQLVNPDRDRLLRAEDVLDALDAFPANHASPLSSLFEGAGRDARDAQRHPALLIVVLVALGIFFYLLRHPMP